MNMNSHFDEANQSGVEFLLTDLDIALTFMDIAETSGLEETVRRNHKNARKAYDTILGNAAAPLPGRGATQRD